VAKRDKPKPYDSVEQALVEELGAKLVGVHKNIGEFPIEDGDDGEELVRQCVSQLELRKLLPAGACWSECLRGANEVNIHVYEEDGSTEYLFRVLPDGTLWPKRFHKVEILVFVSEKCEETA